MTIEDLIESGIELQGPVRVVVWNLCLAPSLALGASRSLALSGSG